MPMHLLRFLCHCRTKGVDMLKRNEVHVDDLDLQIVELEEEKATDDLHGWSIDDLLKWVARIDRKVTERGNRLSRGGDAWPNRDKANKGT